VEQLDGVGCFVATHFSVCESQFVSESLEVDKHKEDNYSCQQAGNVGRVITVEGVLKGTDLVRLRIEVVE